MKTVKVFFFLSFVWYASFSQGPGIQWQRCYGGTGGEDAQTIKQTSDGGFIVAGGTNSNDGDVSGFHALTDFWIIKIDSIGTLQWQKCLGGSAYERAYSVVQSFDGGYVIAGGTSSNDGDVSGNHSNIGYGDFWIVKLDSNGNLLWKKCYGGSNGEGAYAIVQTNDSCYLILGKTASTDGDVVGNSTGQAYWLIKIDDVGNILWQKCVAASFGSIDRSSLILLPNENIVISGYNNDDYWIAELDTARNIEWQNFMGGSRQDGNNSTFRTYDGGYVMAGKTDSNDGDVTNNQHWSVAGYSEIWVVKTDSAGNLERQRCLGGSDNDEAWSVIQDYQGGYIVGGWTLSYDGDISGNHGSSDYWVVKLDTAFNIVWQKCLGGFGVDISYSMMQTNDSGIVVAGFSTSNDGDVSGNHGGFGDIWVVKLAYLNLDAAMQGILYPTLDTLCDSTLSPMVRIRNNGLVSLNTVTINYQVDGGIIQNYNWNGNLAQDLMTDVTLPVITTTAGSHTLAVFVSNPNGGIDENSFNDTITQSYYINQNATLLPVQEGFESPSFPPIGWMFIDQNNLFYHLTSAGGFGNSTSCMRARCFSQNGDGDLVSSKLDFTGLVAPATLTFSLASAMKNSNSLQSLTVYSTSDCAATWNQIYYKADTALATTNYHSGNYNPLPNEWRTESIDLTSFIGEPHIQLLFEFAGQNTNNLHIDDINIVDAASGIAHMQSSLTYFTCYLNKDNNLLLNFYANGNEQVQVQLLDIAGRVLLSQPLTVTAGFNKQQVYAGELGAGVYLVRLMSEGGGVTKKLIVQ